MRSNSKVGVGIIGCGIVAYIKHLPALKEIEEAEIVAVFDRNRTKAERVAFEYGKNAAVYDDLDELLRDTRVDTVYVLTNTGMHSAITVKALLAGKHVFCEKPMAISVSEAEKMLEAAEKTGKKLTIGYQNRFLPEVSFLKGLCDEGYFGDIYHARCLAVRRRAIPVWGSSLSKSANGGGCLIDIGTHAIDLALYLMNNYEVDSVMGNTYQYLGKQPTKANANGLWKAEDFEVEDSAFAFIRMKNGATVSLDCSWALNTLEVFENKVMLCGSKAGADMFDGVRLNGEVNGNLTITKPDIYGQTASDIPKPDRYKQKTAESKAWIEAIINDTAPLVKAKEALTVSKVIEAIYTSARTGNSVKL